MFSVIPQASFPHHGTCCHSSADNSALHRRASHDRAGWFLGPVQCRNIKGSAATSFANARCKAPAIMMSSKPRPRARQLMANSSILTASSSRETTNNPISPLSVSLSRKPIVITRALGCSIFLNNFTSSNLQRVRLNWFVFCDSSTILAS